MSKLFIQLKLDSNGKSKIANVLTDRSDRAIFMDLVELMKPFWNSIDYKSMKNLGEMLGINSRQYMSTIINRFEKLSLVKRHNKFLYINYNYVTKCEDRLLRKEVLELFESDEPKNKINLKEQELWKDFKVSYIVDTFTLSVLFSGH